MARRRWLSRLIRAGSTLSAAAVLVAWVGSVVGSVRWDDDPYTAHLEWGVIDLVYLDLSGYDVTRCGGGTIVQPPPSWTVAGVRFQYGHYYDEPIRWRPRIDIQDANCAAIAVPLWMLFVPLSAVAVVTNTRYIRGRGRARANACAACGYDRAGLAASALCPECGALNEP